VSDRRYIVALVTLGALCAAAGAILQLVGVLSAGPASVAAWCAACFGFGFAVGELLDRLKR
jgi:hypothetical protein